jgi:hypothetical protein
MDPVPLGLGLALVAIILYLFKELGEKQRALTRAEAKIDEFQRLVSSHPELQHELRASLEDRRDQGAVSSGTLIEGKAVS